MSILKKVIKVILNTLMTLIIIIGMAFVLLYCIGIEPFVVKSGSMEPAIHTGSLCFINKHVTYEELKENDIIAFTAKTGDKVTHRVVQITSEGMETKGDANDESDGITTTRANLIGKNIFSIPKLGYAVTALQTTRGRIILITAIIVILLAGFLFDDKEKTKKNIKEDSKEKTKEDSQNEGEHL